MSKHGWGLRRDGDLYVVRVGGVGRAMPQAEFEEFCKIALVLLGGGEPVASADAEVERLFKLLQGEGGAAQDAAYLLRNQAREIARLRRGWLMSIQAENQCGLSGAPCKGFSDGTGCGCALELEELMAETDRALAGGAS